MNFSKPISSSPETFTVVCFTIVLFFIVIAIALMIFYIHKNNKQMKKLLQDQNHEDFENFKESIIKENSKISADVIKALSQQESYRPISKREEIRSHQEELLKTFSKIRDIIKDDLFSTMNSTGACRTALYLFHNGTRSTQGIDFLKMSCIGERTLIGSGIKEQILNQSAMPVNLFDVMIEKLVENGRYIVINDEETMNTARAKFISANKIKYSIAVSIYDNNNNILGFVLAEFDQPYNKIESDRESKELTALANKISPILSFSEYANITMATSSQDEVISKASAEKISKKSSE